MVGAVIAKMKSEVEDTSNGSIVPSDTFIEMDSLTAGMEKADLEAEDSKVESADLLAKAEDNTLTGQLEETVAEKVEEKTNLKLWKRIPGFGFLLVIGSVLANTLANVLVKDFNGIEPPVLLLYKSLITLSVSMPWAVAMDKPPFRQGMANQDKLLITIRGVLGFAQMITYIYSVKYMHLGDQKMVTATRPVFVAIAARIFLKESFGIMDSIAMVLVMVGVVFVVKPPVIFGIETGEQYDSRALYSAIAVFITTILSSTTTVIVRKLRKEHVVSLTSVNMIMFAVESFAYILLLDVELYNPTWMEKLRLVGLSMFQFSGCLLIILALKLEKANPVTLMNHSGSIVAAFLFQIFYYQVLPDVYSIVGTVLVTLAIFVLAGKSVLTSKKKGESG